MEAARTEDGVFKTSDGGRKWRAADAGLPKGAFSVCVRDRPKKAGDRLRGRQPRSLQDDGRRAQLASREDRSRGNCVLTLTIDPKRPATVLRGGRRRGRCLQEHGRRPPLASREPRSGGDGHIDARNRPAEADDRLHTHPTQRRRQEHGWGSELEHDERRPQKSRCPRLSDRLDRARPRRRHGGWGVFDYRFSD
jgi:hypothetical protein